MEQEAFSLSGRGGEANPETTTCWSQGHGLLLSGDTSNEGYIPDVREALLFLGFVILGNLFPFLGLLIAPHSGVNNIPNFLRFY